MVCHRIYQKSESFVLDVANNIPIKALISHDEMPRVKDKINHGTILFIVALQSLLMQIVVASFTSMKVNMRARPRSKTQLTTNMTTGDVNSHGSKETLCTSLTSESLITGVMVFMELEKEIVIDI